MKRKDAERRGRRGERMAAFWLMLKGWTILARRVQTARGEIDVIARRRNLVAFVEVKWRAKAAELEYAIDEKRLHRVAAAAECVAHNYVRSGDDIRVDVMLLAPRTVPRHIVNVWQP